MVDWQGIWDRTEQLRGFVHAQMPAPDVGGTGRIVARLDAMLNALASVEREAEAEGAVAPEGEGEEEEE
jgi:hypothetical protein